MDDLIYILLGIIWIAVAFYRQSQKKKAKAATMNAPMEYSEDIPEEKSVKSEFDELFEQFGMKSKDDAPVFEHINQESSADPFQEFEYEQEFEHSFEEEYNRKGITTIEEIDIEKPEYFSKNSEEIIDQIEDSDEQDDTDEKVDFFDLKKAVIYAEILNRPKFQGY